MAMLDSLLDSEDQGDVMTFADARQLERYLSGITGG